MGTPDDEVGREPDEGPMHEVTFAKPFAMSRFHVTAGEWDSYVRQTGVKIANGGSPPRPRMHRQQAALSPGATAAGGAWTWTTSSST